MKRIILLLCFIVIVTSGCTVNLPKSLNGIKTNYNLNTNYHRQSAARVSSNSHNEKLYMLQKSVAA